MVVGEGVERPLVERAAGGEGGDDEGVDELVVTADLGGETGEPAVERLVPATIGGIEVLERCAQLGGTGDQRPTNERDRLAGRFAALFGRLVHGHSPSTMVSAIIQVPS